MTDSGDGAALAQSRAAATRGRAFPAVAWLHPVFCPVEQAGERWRILGPAEPTAQQARDSLAREFALRAACAPILSAECGAYGSAADRLSRERPSRIAVAGQWFAIVRLEQFLRTGRDGPAPPRRGDERPPANLDEPPAARFLGDAGTCFAIMERTEAEWQQAWPGEYETPAQARAALIAYIRERAAAPGDHAARLSGAYAHAAEGLARYHVNEVIVAGHQFRVTRVERAARPESMPASGLQSGR